MLVEKVSFDLFNGLFPYSVTWIRVGNDWKIEVHRFTSAPGGNGKSFEPQFISIFITGVPTVERSIDFIGSAEREF